MTDVRSGTEAGKAATDASEAVGKKRRKRFGGVDETVLSLSAKGLSHGEISAHLAEVYGTEVSKSTWTRSTRWSSSTA